MSYAEHSEYAKVSFLARVKSKIGKRLAKNFPMNSVRKYGLKLCGFEIGNKVYIGEDLIITSNISEKSCHLTIKDRVAIAPRVTLILASDANWSILMEELPFIKSSIVLEEDCWIGAGVIIMPGVTVGKCAIVGAGSIVFKDVPPFTVVAGVPAKEIKKITLKNSKHTS